MHGRTVSWPQSLQDTYTDGIVILHRGRRVYERYFGALQPHLPHSCFSITKSYAATLAATLIHEGVLDENRTVSHYLPEMTGTAYREATLRQVLDMQIGVAYSELYADPKAHIWDYTRAGGLRSRPRDYAGPTNFYEYLQTLRPEGDHGAAFAYKTINTEVMCWVMKRVTGVALQDMLSQRIWSRIGCEEDGYITVDSIGVPMGGGGLSASLRDLCRFGELMRCEGAWGGKQLIPAEVVADIRRGSDPRKFAQGRIYAAARLFLPQHVVGSAQPAGPHRGSRHPRSASVHRTAGGSGDCTLCVPSDCVERGQRSDNAAGICGSVSFADGGVRSRRPSRVQRIHVVVNHIGVRVLLPTPGEGAFVQIAWPALAGRSSTA